jgi:cytochrome c553
MRDPWVRWSILWLAAITVVSIAIGFLWLPSAHADFTVKGIWDGICRAAGVPAEWGPRESPAATKPSTAVVLLPAMARAGTPEAAGRGASLALAQCTMCHGARGVSEANAPNLAGQYPEVVMKQLKDYQRGDRTERDHAGARREAFRARHRGPREPLRVVAASAKRARSPTWRPCHPLVKVGDPMRNIAPCASCHGGIEQKLGTPWLEGMPKDYLVQQIKDFASGTRRNDSHAQMRNMARALTAKEIEEVAVFYARQGAH